MKKKLILIVLLIFIVIALMIFIFHIDKYNTEEENKVSSSSKEDEEKIKEEQELIDVFNKNCKITVYLNSDVSDEEVENIKNELNKKNYISSIELISSEDALEDLKGRFSDNENIFEGMEDVLPTSYELRIKFETIEDVMNDEYIEKIKEELEEVSNIKKVSSNDETMKSIYENYGIEASKDALENGPDSLQKYEIKNNAENNT